MEGWMENLMAQWMVHTMVKWMVRWMARRMEDAMAVWKANTMAVWHHPVDFLLLPPSSMLHVLLLSPRVSRDHRFPLHNHFLNIANFYHEPYPNSTPTDPNRAPNPIPNRTLTLILIESTLMTNLYYLYYGMRMLDFAQSLC